MLAELLPLCRGRTAAPDHIGAAYADPDELLIFDDDNEFVPRTSVP